MTAPTCETRAGLAYATHDGVELAGDLYLPAGEGPFPAVVAVHGGGWVTGARTAFQYWGPYLAERGYAVFSISYRLATPERATYPQAVQDVRAAVQFIRGEAANFRIDPERIALMGASAGAHLASMVALAGEEPVFAGGYPQDPHASLSTQVKVLIGVYGVYDLTQMWANFLIQSPAGNSLELFLGASLPENRRIYFEASPLSFATRDRNQVAVFLACGTEDDLVDRGQQHDAFMLALKRAGFYVRAATLAGAGHYWMNDPLDETASHSGFLAPRLVRFLKERL